MSRTQGRRQRLAGVVVLCALIAPLTPLPVLASSPPTTEAGPPERPEARSDAIALDPVEEAGAVWTWSKGRRSYRVLTKDFAPAYTPGRGTLPEPPPPYANLDDGPSPTRILAYDADTLEIVGDRQLHPPVTHTTTVGKVRVQGHAGAVDEEAGRLFFAYAEASVSTGSPVGAQPCAVTPSSAVRVCVAGVHVLDAETLEPLGSIPLEPLRVDGTPVSAWLRAMTYVPASEEVPSGKLLLVLEDTITDLWGTAQADSPPRYHGANFVRVVQLDTASLRQDWSYRVDGCRGTREPRETQSQIHTRPRPNPAAVLRSTGVGDEAVYVACHTSNTTAAVTVARIPLDEGGHPPPPIGVTGMPGASDAGATGTPNDDAGPGDVPRPAVNSAQLFGGPDRVSEIIADQAGQRLVMKSNESGEVWWVFDVPRRAYIGTVGIGPFELGRPTMASLDPATGRLYVLTPRADTGGLYVTDIRRDPVPQALYYPEFNGYQENRKGLNAENLSQMTVLSASTGRPTRVYTPLWWTYLGQREGVLRWFDDHSAAALPDEPPQDYEGRTLDLDEVPDITAVTYDGAVRGYGARVILLGGVEGATRAGPADPIGVARASIGGDGAGLLENAVTSYKTLHNAGVRPDGCSNTDRQLTLAFVGRHTATVVDAGGSQATATPVAVDAGTSADLQVPVSRCTANDWDEIWSRALFAGAPADEPSFEQPAAMETASCVSSDDDPEEDVGDPTFGGFAASVACGSDGTDGWARSRGLGLDGLELSSALSSFRIYVDPARGLVARMESVTRGLQVVDALRIDTVRSVAESWANGRRQPMPEDARAADYDPNCDFERTAGTCYQRHIFGFVTEQYACGPCGDEAAMIDAAHRAFGANGALRFRHPDPHLARGSENGYLSAVKKPDDEGAADATMNADLLRSVVPALEIIRYAPQARPPYGFGNGPRGRQVIHLAGVEASSTYGIQCLLIYDAEANVCAPRAVDPAALTIELRDPSGTPLAGGAFELRSDLDGDGIGGLSDALVTDGVCLTAADGVGTCTFTGLDPGAYVVSQTGAPPGFGVYGEPVAIEVAPGESRTVTFTNVSDQAAVSISAVGPDGHPAPGATFAVYPDPDGDGLVAADAVPVGQCTTDDTGSCQIQVPVGEYVLVQTRAADGLLPIDPVAFSLAAGGQVAAVEVANARVATTGPPTEPAPAPVRYQAPPVAPGPTQRVDAGPLPPAVEAPRTALPDTVGGTVVRVIRAPGDVLRLLAREPREALAWTASLLLFALSVMAVRRRQMLGGLLTPRIALATGPPRPPGPPAGSRATLTAATAVADAPVVAGGAPAAHEQHAVRVVAAVGTEPLARFVRQLSGAGGCELVEVVRSVEHLRVSLARSAADVVVVDLALDTGGAEDVCDLLPGLQAPGRVIGIIPPGRSTAALTTRGHAAGLGGLLAAYDDLLNGQLAYAAAAVAGGKPYYGPSVQAILQQRQWTKRRGSLTRREVEVARLAAAGVRRAQIAERLYVSPWTVKRHLASIRTKLGVTDPWDLEQFRHRLRELGLEWDRDEDPRRP